MKKYLNYTIEQFVSDEYFQQWVKGTDTTVNHLWAVWLEDHPEKLETVNEARDIILSFDNQPTHFDELRAEFELGKLLSKIEEKEQERNKYTLIGLSSGKLAVAAAIVMLICFSGLLVLFKFNSPSTYTTSFNETREVILPDGSTVVLNSNSFLKFNKDWEESPREVWIEGEALFKVKKIKVKKDYKKFVVYSSNLSINVLGTEFNVNTRRNRTRVVLKEGSVKILERQTQNKILMVPGDMVEVSQEGKIITEKVKPQLYTSWKNKELVFDQTSLEEIAQTLEDNFGYKVIFKDASIKARRFTGTGKTDQIDILLKKISKSNGLNINTNQKIITINNP